MRRYTVQIAELINPHAQRDPDLRVEFQRPSSREVRRQIIKLTLVTEAPKYDDLREPGISLGEPLRFEAQEIRSIAAGVDALEHTKSNFTGGRHSGSGVAYRIIVWSRALSPFHTIWTPMQTRMNDDMRVMIFIAESPTVRAIDSANR